MCMAMMMVSKQPFLILLPCYESVPCYSVPLHDFRSTSYELTQYIQYGQRGSPMNCRLAWLIVALVGRCINTLDGLNKQIFNIKLDLTALSLR